MNARLMEPVNKNKFREVCHLSYYILLRCLCVCAGLTDDMAGGLEGKLYNAFVLVRSSQVEDGEDVLPA